jgi:serine/threonine protein kinase
MNSAQHRLALPAGYELGRYRLKEILGSGGFGITYLAEDTTLNRRVAIKELLPNDIATRVDGTTVVAKTQTEEESLTWARERFVGEGRALAACEHPNIVNVYEMVEANGTAYMVTKYEDGRSLEQWLRNLGRPPNETELRGILMPLLSGLEAVHKAGFLHRDIKPENIYMTQNGRPVLLDFGSARQAVSNRSMAMTSIVTSGYAPFEQYHEDGNQGPWSDIYALGAVMYRAITGKKPPEATRRLKEDPIEKLAATYAGKYDAEFLRAIDKSLAVDEKKRPQSVAEWRKMLGSDDRLPLDSDETRLLPRTVNKPSTRPEFVRSKAALVGGVAGGVLLLLLLLVVLFAGHAHRPKRPLLAKATPSPSTAKSSPAVQPSASPAKPSSEASATPAVAEASATPASPEVAEQIDPRLVGTWEARIKWPPSGGEGQSQDVIGSWKDSSGGVWTFLPNGTYTLKTRGEEHPSAEAEWQTKNGKIAVKEDKIVDGVDRGSTHQLAISEDGQTLSGDWPSQDGQGTLKLERIRSDSRRTERIRWEQSADGHYILSGPYSDAGAITATGEGKFQQFSNAATEPVEVSYEFHGTKLVTVGPLGNIEWRRVSSHASNESNTASHESESHPAYDFRKDLRRHIMNRVLRHLP